MQGIDTPLNAIERVLSRFDSDRTLLRCGGRIDEVSPGHYRVRGVSASAAETPEANRTRVDARTMVRMAGLAARRGARAFKHRKSARPEEDCRMNGPAP